jgi:3-hydroxyisobutyrate dehydrogenase
MAAAAPGVPGGDPVVAVLGAGGTMGKGMARNLARAGIPVRAWNRTAERIEDLAAEEGVAPCPTALEAAAGADVLLTMVSDAEALLEAMEGSDGAVAGANPGSLWLQMSTIGIEGIERCADLARDAGLILVDAPVLGTKQPAEEGELVILAAGPEDARARLTPVFDAIGKRTIWIGEAGAGSRLKVVVNSWIVSVVEGTAEMLSLAEGLGLEPGQALEAVAGGPLDLPYMQMKGRAMLARDFTPSFRLALAAKDADLAARAAASAGLELPALQAICRRMAAAAEEHGDEDLAAVYLASAPMA